MGIDSTITMKSNVPSTVDTPPAGKYRLFVADDGFMKLKDSAGQVYSAGTTFLVDTGVPAGSLGYNGYFYLNDANADLYEKIAGSWVLVGSFAGPQGPTGAMGAGVPIGGTTGQALVKINATDYNTQWVSLTSSLISYTPSVPGDWITIPTTVYEALNELARKALSQPDDYQHWEEDFLGNCVNSANIGYHLGWFTDKTGTNAVSFATSNVTGPTVKGVHLLSTGTTATGKGFMYLFQAAIVFGGYVWDQEWKIRILNQADGTDSYNLNFGFYDSPSVSGLDCNDGVYVQHDETTGNFVVVCSKGATRDKFNTGIAIDITTFHRARIKINKAGTQVSFYYDGTLVNTYTSSNIPILNANATGIGAKIEKTAGTTSRAVYIDWIHMECYT